MISSPYFLALEKKKKNFFSPKLRFPLKIFERPVPAAYKITLYSVLNVNTAESIFSVLSKANICKGNSDFPDLIKYKMEVAGPSHFQSPCQDDTGLIQTYRLQTWDGFSVIRHVSCSLLTNDLCCQQCTLYRATLFAIRSRLLTAPSDD